MSNETVNVDHMQFLNRIIAKAYAKACESQTLDQFILGSVSGKLSQTFKTYMQKLEVGNSRSC